MCKFATAAKAAGIGVARYVIEFYYICVAYPFIK
jgi:hypothetical protein